MKLINQLEQLSTTCPTANKLLNIYNNNIVDINSHLSQITKELPEFDNHDEKHSKKVLENMLAKDPSKTEEETF